MTKAGRDTNSIMLPKKIGRGSPEAEAAIDHFGHFIGAFLNSYRPAAQQATASAAQAGLTRDHASSQISASPAGTTAQRGIGRSNGT